MKNYLPILLFVFIQSNSQTIIDVTNNENKDIIVDYKKFVSFQFSGVNTFLVEGNVTSTPFNVKFNDFIISVPEKNTSPTGNEGNEVVLLKSIRDKSNKKLSASDAQKILNIIDNKVTIESDKNDFIEALEEFIVAYDKVQLYITLEDKLLNKIGTDVVIYDVSVLKNNCNTDYRLCYTGNNPKQDVITAIQTLRSRYATMQRLYEKLNQDTEKKSTIQFVPKENTEIDIQKITVSNSSKKIFSEQMESVTKQMETFGSTENQNKIITKAHAGIDLYKKIAACNFTIINSDGGLQVLSDKLTVTPTLKNKKNEVVKTYNPITIFAKGGWKVNFSSGYLISFIGNDNYSKFRNIAGDVIGIKESNKDKVTNAFGGLIHAYQRKANGFEWGLSAGLSLTEDTNMGFYGGLSALFLEDNRLVFTAGYSLTKVKRLNESNLQLNDNGQLVFLSAQDTEIVYDQIYKGAFFVGVTYNLSKN